MRAFGGDCIRGRGCHYCIELLLAWRGRQRGEVEPPAQNRPGESSLHSARMKGLHMEIIIKPNRRSAFYRKNDGNLKKNGF